MTMKNKSSDVIFETYTHNLNQGKINNLIKSCLFHELVENLYASLHNDLGFIDGTVLRSIKFQNE